LIIIKFEDIFEKKFYVIVIFYALFCLRLNARYMEQPIMLQLNELSGENLNEKTKFKNDMI